MVGRLTTCVRFHRRWRYRFFFPAGTLITTVWCVCAVCFISLLLSGSVQLMTSFLFILESVSVPFFASFSTFSQWPDIWHALWSSSLWRSSRCLKLRTLCKSATLPSTPQSAARVTCAVRSTVFWANLLATTSATSSNVITISTTQFHIQSFDYLFILTGATPSLLAGQCPGCTPQQHQQANKVLRAVSEQYPAEYSRIYYMYSGRAGQRAPGK